MVQRHGLSLTLLVNISHVSVFRVKQDFSVILEVDLYNLVAQSEHDSMFGTHPLLDVNRAWWVLQLRILFVQYVSLYKLFFLSWIVVLLKIRFEMLKQCHFLLQFFGVVVEVILR